MKRMFGVFCGLALCAAPAFATLLVNGDLELGADGNTADGWTLIEPDMDDAGMPTNSAEFIGFANHTMGGARGLWYRSFEGGLGGDNPMQVDAILQQDVAGTAGDIYTASAWFRYETNYSGLDPFAPTQTLFGLEFLDAGNSVISSTIVDIDGVYDVMQLNQWQQFTIMDMAPMGTVSVRVSASMIDGVLEPANPQSAFVDDFVLTPEPTSGLLLLAGMSLLRRRR